MLFLRALTGKAMIDPEETAWYELGAFVQFCNDAQDLHKDLQKRMRTFASVRPDLKTIAEDINSQKVLTFSLIKQIPFREKEKDDMLLLLHVMFIGLMGKLRAFSSLCENDFNFDAFLLKRKEEIRAHITPRRLFLYVFPRVLNYQYSRVESLPWDKKF